MGGTLTAVRTTQLFRVLATGLSARTALPRANAGLTVGRSIPLLLPALEPGVVVLVLSLMQVRSPPADAALLSRDRQLRHLRSEWQGNQEAEQPAARAGGNEGTRETIEGRPIHTM